MSLAVISINTETRECVLTVDGALVPADKIEFFYGKDYNGQLMKAFKYAIEKPLPDGGTEEVEYEMSQPETIDAKVARQVAQFIKNKNE